MTLLTGKVKILIGFLIIVVLLSIQSRFRLSLVVGNSMLPTFRSGDLILIDKQSYFVTEPQRDDIVLAKKRSDLIVKRIVGLPGETIELRNGVLFVNDRLVLPNHPVNKGSLTIGRGHLGPDKYALLGDNHAILESVCVHAILPPDKIVGRVIGSLRLWP
jgi:signal peptidase I